MTHTRSKPYHPMTQGKIERYDRFMKNQILLENYYLPDQFEARLAESSITTTSDVTTRFYRTSPGPTSTTVAAKPCLSGGKPSDEKYCRATTAPAPSDDTLNFSLDGPDSPLNLSLTCPEGSDDIHPLGNGIQQGAPEVCWPAPRKLRRNEVESVA
jgi:hypothetical protein